MKNSVIDLDLKVSDLVDITSKWWDIEKLHSLFYPIDVEITINIKPIVFRLLILFHQHL